MEEITNRITLISDMNAAFSGSKEKLEKLQEMYTELMGFNIKWEADPNWEDKLRQYAR